METTKKLFVHSIIILLISCSPSESNQSRQSENFDIQHVRKHIDKANKVYGERFLHDEPEWYSERYCADACAMPENRSAVCGIENIKDYYYNAGYNKELTLEIVATEVYGSPEIVMEEGTYSFPDNQGGSYDQGKFIALWKNDNGAWKIYREIWNSNVPKE